MSIESYQRSIEASLSRFLPMQDERHRWNHPEIGCFILASCVSFDEIKDAYDNCFFLGSVLYCDQGSDVTLTKTSVFDVHGIVLSVTKHMLMNDAEERSANKKLIAESLHDQVSLGLSIPQEEDYKLLEQHLRLGVSMLGR